MTENSKEIQVVDQDQAPVGGRRQWTRPVVIGSELSKSESSANTGPDGGVIS